MKKYSLIIVIFFIPFSCDRVDEENPELSFVPIDCKTEGKEETGKAEAKCLAYIYEGDLIFDRFHPYSEAFLNSIEILEGNLVIKNLNIRKLNFLTSLYRIDGDVLISGNKDLIHLNGLSNLQYLNGNSFIVKNNSQLPQWQPIAILQKLQRNGFDGYFEITGNYCPS